MHLQRSAEDDTDRHLASNFQPKITEDELIMLGTSEPITEM